MPKYYVEKQESLTRIFSAEIEAKDEEDSQDIFEQMKDEQELDDPYEKIRDCDWEIREVKNV